jgi:hypothetical protein
MENDKKPADGPAILMVAIISAVVFIAAFIGGLAMIAIPLGTWSPSVLMGPFNIIAVFPFFAVLLIAAAGVCIVTAIRKKTLWWLMPAGTVLLVIGWLASCRIFMNLVEKQMN